MKFRFVLLGPDDDPDGDPLRARIHPGCPTRPPGRAATSKGGPASYVGKLARTGAGESRRKNLLWADAAEQAVIFHAARARYAGGKVERGGIAAVLVITHYKCPQPRNHERIPGCILQRTGIG